MSKDLQLLIFLILEYLIDIMFFLDINIMNSYWIYIMMNNYNTVNYTGVTSDLVGRVYQHKNKLIEGFTKKYNVTKLVYFEEYNNINQAIAREKQIKGWIRKKKIALIQSMNPDFRDFYDDIIK